MDENVMYLMSKDMNNVQIIAIPDGEEKKWRINMVGVIIAGNFPTLRREAAAQIQETKYTK